MHLDADSFVFGDGRRKVEPRYPDSDYLGTPRRATLGRVRSTINTLIKYGQLVHSPRGETVWMVQEWSDLAGRDVAITVQLERGKVIGYVTELVR